MVHCITFYFSKLKGWVFICASHRPCNIVLSIMINVIYQYNYPTSLFTQYITNITAMMSMCLLVCHPQFSICLFNCSHSNSNCINSIDYMGLHWLCSYSICNCIDSSSKLQMCQHNQAHATPTVSNLFTLQLQLHCLCSCSSGKLQLHQLHRLREIAFSCSHSIFNRTPSRSP